MKKRVFPIAYVALVVSMFVLIACGGGSSSEEANNENSDPQADPESPVEPQPEPDTDAPNTETDPEGIDDDVSMPIDPVEPGSMEMPSTIIAAGDAVPGLSGEIVEGISNIHINNSGQIAATVNYQSGDVRETALLVGDATNLDPVLVSGQTFPGRPATIRVSGATGLLDDDGTLYATVAFGGARNSSALFERAPGTTEFFPLLETGDVLEGTQGGIEVRNFGRLGINGRGISFRVNLDGNASAGLYYSNGETTVLVAPDFFSGSSADPDVFLLPGTVCRFELDIDSNNSVNFLHDTLPSGGVVFQAQSAGAASNCPLSAVVIFDGQDYTVVAQSRGAIPGDASAEFGEITLRSVGANGDIVFSSRITSTANGVSYWLYTATGELGLLLLSEEEVQTNSGVVTIENGTAMVDRNRRVVARVNLDDDSDSILTGTARLTQPYPSFASPGASNLMPILTTLEQLQPPFLNDDFFQNIGNVFLRGANGILFFAELANAGDSSFEDIALWLHTPETELERIADGTDGQAFPSSLDSSNRLVITDSGEVFMATTVNGTSRGGQITRLLGPE